MKTLDSLPENLKSIYMSESFREERILFSDISFDNNSISATINIEDCAVSPVWGIHITGIIAYRSTGLLLIAHECLTSGKTKEEIGEILGVEFELEEKKKIHGNQPIHIKLKKTNREEHKKYWKDTYEGELGNGSFTVKHIVTVLK